MRIFDADVTGSLHVSGSSNFKGGVTVSGSQTITGSLTVDGNAKIGDQLTDIHTVTGSLNVTGSISGSLTGVLRTDYIDFNTNSVVVGGIGRVTWNDGDGTLDVGLKGGNVTLQLGQEQVVRVVNNSGGQLLESNYQVVKLDGAQGNRVRVSLAQADNDNNSAETLGLVTETIDSGGEGFVTTSGLVRKINTTGALQGELWSEGDRLYLSPFTPGAITNVKPDAPNHTVIVGYVVRVHATVGAIFVKVDNGYEIDELHNVKINTGSLSYGDLLMRSGSVWVNSKNLSGSYQLTGSLDISGSQTINGNQIISGSITITQNISVLGTSSFVYVTSSNLNLTGPFIYTNVFEPIERFGGLVVFDSGSSNATASLLWDSQNNHWIYQNASGSNYSGGMLLSGPRNTGSLGDELGLTSTRIPKSVGGDHLDNSNIYDTGTVVKIISNSEITGSLKVTGGISGSLDYSYIQNVPSLVSGSAQINITGTTGYSSVSSSIATALDGKWRASDGITSDDIGFNETVIIQGGANTNVTFLPGANTFTINSSHQSVSAAASSNNSGRTYIQDILLDSFGHITGITTATETVVNTDIYTTGATFNTSDGVVTFTRNDGNTYTVDIDGRFSTTDYYVTGGTFNTGTGNLRLTRNDGGTIDTNLDGRYLTAHPSVSAASSSDNSGRTYIQDILLDQYGHITGITTATETVVNTDTYTTGGTTNSTTGLITFTKNDGGTYTTSISGYVTTQIANLVDSAPTTLDTLNELAAALGDDPNFATTIATAIGNKVSKSGDTMTGNLTAPAFIKSGGTSSQFLKADGSVDTNTYLTSFSETDTLATVTARGASTATPVTFNSNVTLGNSADLVFSDLSGTFPTSGKGFDWTLNNDGARIYAIQPSSDSIDFVFQLRDNATTNDRFVFHVDDYQGPAFDKYPLIIRGGTEFDLVDSALFVRGTEVITNGRVLKNVTGNISMFTNDSGYLTAHPSVTAASSSNNSGRTYIQDILLDSFGHITGITTATETVTDTNDFINNVVLLGNTLRFTGTGGAFSGDIDLTPFTADNNTYVTGGTFNTGTGNLRLTRNDGGTIDVSLDGRYLTAHPSVSAASSSNNSGRTYIQDILLDSFGHITGITTATETVTDTFTTGATFNTSDGVITFTNNNGGGTFTVDIDGRFLTSYSETDTLASVTARGNTTNTSITVSGLTSNNDVVISGGTLTVYESVSGATVFAVDGTNGRLFAVTDDLSNSLFSVNTISGLPVIEAFADYHIVMGRFNQNDFYLGTTGEIGMGTAPVSGYKLAVVGNIRATSFVKSGGTSSQFLMADGSVSTNPGWLTTYNNYYTTGVTFNTGDGVLTFTRNDGGTYTVDLDGRYGTSSTDYYTTGATFNTSNGIITFTRNDGGTYTVDLDGKYLDSSSYTASDVLSKLLTVDGASSGLDADLLDGQHGSYYYPASNPSGYISSYLNYYTTGATFNTGNGIITFTRNDGGTYTVDIDGKYAESVHTHDDRYLPYEATSDVAKNIGWYTIAVNSGNRASGKFLLRDTSSGNHQSVVFYATHHFGNYSDITVLMNSYYGGNPFRTLRIVDGGTYDGALLQVYIDLNSTQVKAWLLEDIQDNGWIIKNWIPDGTDPGDVNNFAAMTETPAQVNLDNASPGGITTTGDIYGGGDIVQYLYLNTNNYSTTLDTRYYTETEIGNFFGGSTAITGYNKSNWDTAFGWGNHAGQGYATTGYVTTQIANLVNSAPAVLDTLGEIATALGNDANFATTITTAIGNKVSKSGDTMTGDLVIGNAVNGASTQAFGDFTQLLFDNSHSDTNRGPNKIVMHNNGGSWIGGFGIHSDTVSYYTGGGHRWYKTTSQTASTLMMTLDSSGNLSLGGNITGSTFYGDLVGNASTVTNGVYTNGSYSNPSWITSLAGSKITGNIGGNANNITAYTINQNLGTTDSPTFNNVTATGVYGTNTSSTRNKYNVYSNSGTYAIGMESGENFGGLADWAMTFQMNNDDDRGFWWGDDAHSTSQGAMALTTNGYLTVARGVRVGYGESDTTSPTVPLQVYGSGSLVFDVQGSLGQLFSVTDTLSGSLYSVNDISGLPILEVFSDDRVVLGSYGTNAFVVSGTTTTISGSLQTSGSVAHVGTVTINGGTVWHSGNDGAGSGLDADLLDGYHGSNYIGKNGNSYYQLDTWLQSTGTHGFYSPSSGAGTHFYPNATSYGSFRIEGGKNNFRGIELYDLTKKPTWMWDNNGGGMYSQTDSSWYYYYSISSGDMFINATSGNKVWHAGNDGSGSGLDADTLDGYHASSFLTAHPSVSAASSVNNSGRTYIQDIFLDSFGHITGITSATETVTDTNYYLTSASFNTGNGTLTLGVTGYGNVTVNLDGRYQAAGSYLTSESDTLATVTARGASTSTAVTFTGGFNDGYITFNAAQINRTSGFVELQYGGSGGVRMFGNTAYPITLASGTGDATFSGGLTVGGSLSYGSYTAASNYVTGADNILLKGNSVGVSGIFFESEKDGTNINHPSDFAFIQYHAYGIGGSSGESNRLVIGVSNDGDDLIVLNPVTTSGLVVRVGAGTTEYMVYHSGNIPTWNQNTSGNAATATLASTVTINYNNDSNSTYQMLWGSGNSVYGTSQVYLNPATDYVYAAAFNATDWFRSTGSNGWYNATYGGGIYQTESTMVRTYDNRGFWIDGGNTNTVQDATLYVTATNNNDWLAIFNAYNSSKTEYGVFVNIAAGATYGYALRTDSSSFTYRVDGSGRVYAPIYYDINDTAYYLNPASTSNLATVKLNSTASGTEVFTVDGVNGRLFTITDDLSDSLFSVNTIAGVPVIEAFSDYRVIIGRYNQYDLYVNASGQVAMGTSTATANYKLTVSGSVVITPTAAWNAATPALNIGGTGDGRLQVRHIYGKSSASASADHLWLQYQNTGNHVQIGDSGGGNHLYVSGNIYMGGYFGGNLVATQSWVQSQGYLTSHPTISAASSVNNSGRTYIQDITLDSNGHVTGIVSATETVTDTNYYLTSASFNTGNGTLTLGVTGYGNVTVNLDGRYQAAGSYLTSESDTLATVVARGSSTSSAITVGGLTVSKSGTDSTITFPAQSNDPGFITHYESSNTARMYFSVSDDDNGTNDSFAFGAGGTYRTTIYTNGRMDLTDIYLTGGGWFRNYGNVGLYNQDYGNHWYATDNATWNSAGNNSSYNQIAMRTGGHQGTVRGYFYADSSNNIGILNNAGNWGIRLNSSRDTVLYGDLTVGQGTSSNIYMTDTDETTRRIHCNSGRIGFLNSSSNWGAYNDNTGNWRTDFAMYSSDWFRSVGTTGWYSESYGGGIYMTDSTWVRVYNNKQFLVENLIQSNTAMYAPIYYDSANNGYYLNPNGYSNLGTVRFNSSGSGAEVIVADGVNGRLFTITDDMTDSIFSVNTISGLPVIEAFADYKVVMGRYGQNDFIINSSGQVSIGAAAQSSYKFTVYGGQFGSWFRGGDTGTGSDIARFVDANSNTQFLVRGDGVVHSTTYLSVAGINTGYNFYNNGTSYFNGSVVVDDNLTITAGYALYGAYGSWTGEGNKIQWHSNNLYFQNTGGGDFIFRNSAGTNVLLTSTDGYLYTRGPMYPGYNGGGLGSQSSYYLYGDTGNTGVRTNGNFLVNSDIYFGSRGVWLTSYLNQAVLTSSSPTFSQVFTTQIGINDSGIDCYMEIGDGNPTEDGIGYGGTFHFYGDKSTSASHLYFGGALIYNNLVVNGRITENSSIRYKKDIQQIENGLEKVLQLSGVTYTKISNEQKEAGVIAEEVAKILPEAVGFDTEGRPDSVSYGRLTALLIEAIKDLKKEIDELKGNK